MSGLVHVATFLPGSAEHGFGLFDLDLFAGGGGATLYATEAATGAVTTLRLDPASGLWAPVQLDHGAGALPPADGALGPASHAALWQANGQIHLLSGGGGVDGLVAFAVAADGTLLGPAPVAGGPGGQVAAQAVLADASGAVLVLAGPGLDGLETWRAAPGGGLMRLSGAEAAWPGGGATDLLAPVTSGGTAFVAAASTGGDALRLYRLDPEGALVAVGGLGAADGLGIAGPTALATAEVAGQSFLILAAANSSSLTVVRVAPDGALMPTDHVVDSLPTRFDAVHGLATATVSGWSFVFAGGGDDGISAMVLLPTGRLLPLAHLADTGQSALADVAALAALPRGGGIDLFATSHSEAGITQLAFSPGLIAPPRVGGAGNDTLQGGIQHDMIWGGAGNDSLSGGAGNDILIDGPGRDTLSGGSGADVFVLVADGEEDTILDFRPGQDRLDLSAWDLLRTGGQLSVQTLADGAIVSYRDERLILRSHDGTPLVRAQVETALILELDHVPVILPHGAAAGPQGRLYLGGATGELFVGGAGDDTLIGGGGADTLRGGAGDDLLEGGGGDDVLAGGPGADTLRGGAGLDTADYGDARGSMLIDLMFPHINTNDAAGDIYDSIENVTGGAGPDNIRGTTGANLLRGGPNVDYLYGRAGDDLLEGGIGDDVLFGGPGADTLDGGAGRDRAQYSEALTPLFLSLAEPWRNTGEAAGDVYIGIEDIAGGPFADTIHGDAGANRLFGREGNDVLHGGAGDDYLNGGANSDWLDGGPGNDTLRGGTHADTFVFTAGHDVIEDFADNLDRIAFDPALWGGGPRSAAQILAQAGVVGNSVVFSFGPDHSLTLQGFTDIAALADDIFLL